MRVQRKTKKPLIITIAVLLAIIIAALLWYYAFSSKNTSDNTDDKTKTSTSQQPEENKSQDGSEKSADNNKKKTEDGTAQSVEHEKEKDLPQLYEGENASESGGLTGVITAKSVTGSTLIIRNTIDQLVGSGSCDLTMTSGSKTITKTAEIVQNPSSSTCAGFDVPVSELGSGRWDIEIKVSSGDKSMTLKETVNI